jgi:hypothetical protein
MIGLTKLSPALLRGTNGLDIAAMDSESEGRDARHAQILTDDKSSA